MAEQNLSYDDIKASRLAELESGVSQLDPDKLAREKTFAELNSLGLQGNLAELESIGFTTVKGAISEDLVARARDAIVRVMERKTGATVDVDSESGENYNGVSLAHYLFDKIGPQSRRAWSSTPRERQNCITHTSL